MGARDVRTGFHDVMTAALQREAIRLCTAACAGIPGLGHGSVEACAA
jgi:hypothetical protein